MPKRIDVNEARKHIGGDDGALLVCAYNDTEKCRKIGIAESIPYPELKERLDSIPQSRELIFFCA